MARTELGSLACATLSLGLFGCARPVAWDRTDTRACDPDDPPIVCFAAEPDQPVELRLEQASIVPGECLRANADARGALVRLVVVGPTGDETSKRVRVRPGQRTVVVARPDASLQVRQRDRCDRTVGTSTA